MVERLRFGNSGRRAGRDTGKCHVHTAPLGSNTLQVPKNNKSTSQSIFAKLFKPKPYEVHTRPNADWHVMYLKTNAFSEEEVPLQPPARFAIWSIGEEQSLRRVVRIEWSPTPIAKYQRFALAVLTSNFTLAIWAPGSTPAEVGKWRRVFIVNHALHRYFESISTSDEELRLRTRVMSFAWSPKVPRNIRSTLGTQFIAVSNDFNEISVLSIKSPHALLASEEDEWEASVVFHFRIVQSANTPRMHYSSLLNDYMSEQKFAHHLSWSHWGVHEEGTFSVLAFGALGCLKLKRFQLQHTTQSTLLAIDDNLHEVDFSNWEGSRTHFTGPIKWIPANFRASPTDSSLRKATLCGFTKRYVYEVALDMMHPDVKEIHSRGLDGRWDDVSGATFSVGQENDIMLHFTSHQSLVSSVTSNLALPVENSDNASIMQWQRRILRQQAMFSSDHDLAGNVHTLNWSIETSPLGDFIATCTSTYPSDQILYAIQVDQSSNITVTPARGNEENFFLAPHCAVEDISSEAILFSISTWAQYCDISPEATISKVSTDIDPSMDAIGVIRRDGALRDEEIRKNVKQFEDELSDGSFNNDKYLIQRLQDTITLRYLLRDKAYRNLLRFVKPLDSHPSACEDDQVGVHLLETILTIPSHLYNDKTKLSQQILHAHATAISRFCGGPSVASPFEEQCEICEAKIQLEDMFEARCTGEHVHKFPRCRLTFLAIQAPFITKRCGLCKKEYLKDDFLANDTPEMDAEIISANGNGHTENQQGSPKITLARLLFASSLAVTANSMMDKAPAALRGIAPVMMYASVFAARIFAITWSLLSLCSIVLASTTMATSLSSPLHKNVRLSGSPANSPRIVSGRASPARSEEGKMEQHELELISQQPDHGMRTTDFFDDTSEAGSDPTGSVSHVAQNGGSRERRRSSLDLHKIASREGPSSKFILKRDNSSKRSSGGSRLHPFLRLAGTHMGPSVFEESSYDGSLEETSNAQARQLYLQATGIDPTSQPDPNIQNATITEGNHLESPLNAKNDRILSAHAITMQALLRDEGGINREIMSPLTEDPRTSQLFASITDRLEGRPDELKAHSRKRSLSAPSRKRVSLIPPPININSPKRTLPDDLVRTPYPFLRRKGSGLLREQALKQSASHQTDPPPLPPKPTTIPDPDANDCVLTLSIRRANPSRSPPKISRLVIPSSANDFRTVRHSTPNIREKHFDTLGFDDAALFRRLRSEYTSLTGSFRIFSARRLKRVAVVAGDDVCSGDAHTTEKPNRRRQSVAVDADESWFRNIPALRSPRLVAYAGLSDTFSEERFLLHFCKPRLGTARYAWVHWARRLASVPAPNVSQQRREEPTVSKPVIKQKQKHRARPSWPLPAFLHDFDDRPDGDGHEDGEVEGVRGLERKDSMRKSGSDGNEKNLRSTLQNSGVEMNVGKVDIARDTEIFEPVGLEFVPGWAVGRIIAAMLLVVLLAVAATAIWTVFGLPRGVDLRGGGGEVGWMGAGNRVETGCVIGILILVVGWLGVGGWVWLSWAVM
ncbi:MAG: hypothetical protein M1820_010295 [Bogoriella megaspora]|nr:MAG: hypothetical protein M1820_010295 [Bogoriella megaspora]